MEVASTQCGSEEKLANAVHRGAVLKRGPKGREMYYFPTSSSGSRKSSKRQRIRLVFKSDPKKTLETLVNR